jgi:hypothetical protein
MGYRLPYTFPIAPSASRTAAYTGSEITNPEGFSGVRVYIDATAEVATAGVTFTIQIKDPLGGDWKDMLSSAQVTAVMTEPVHLTIAPGVATVANVSLANYIGRSFRLVTAVADADALTWSAVGEWLDTV